jgi:hypothetical protein
MAPEKKVPGWEKQHEGIEKKKITKKPKNHKNPQNNINNASSILLKKIESSEETERKFKKRR